jgi:hypothetical protein
MFGLSKKERLIKLEKELFELQKNASHFYDLKKDVEDRAFYELLKLAEEKGISALDASSTQAGELILSEVVLNRQFAFYYNELAIQTYSKMRKLQTGTASPISKEGWLNEIVKPSGWHCVKPEIKGMCHNIISEVDVRLKQYCED